MSLVETTTAPPPVDAKISAALGNLRRRIRLYVFVEGLAALIVWVGLTFWLSFALDYLPVLVGASEMPAWARGIGLAIAAIGAAYVVYRFLASRLFVPLADRSLALVLERRYREFGNSLVTTVELGRGQTSSAGITREMLAETERQATQGIGDIRLREVFNLRPLLRTGLVALLLIASVGVVYATNPAALSKAAKRLYLLDSELWQRYAKIEVVGVQVRRPLQDSVGVEPQEVIFTGNQLKVARGSNVTLRVQADASAAVVPEQCLFHYRTAEGDYGDATMKRVGRERDGYQQYVCDSKPLAGILSSIEFDVLGYDHRLSGYRIEVVDSPSVVATTMDVRYPDYMVDEKNAIRLPREGEPVLASGNQLPLGTHITLHLATSKPLVQVRSRIIDPEAPEPSQSLLKEQAHTFNGVSPPSEFTIDLGTLAGSRTIEITLIDIDGVTSERPHRIFFSALADEAPHWELVLDGIGTQVTPDVMIPFHGKVTDDYGVSRTWLEAVHGDAEVVGIDVPLVRGSEVEALLDVRKERMENKRLDVKPGDKLSVVAHAADRFNLSTSANVGSSERYVLEVVTADQLLAGLDARELALRRRYEVILEELTEMRDSLLRIKPGQTEASKANPLEPSETGDKKLTPEEIALRERDLRLLRAQRAIAQSKKSSQEVAGVAQGFNNIRAELTNNRVDTEDRKSRLKEQIADPLEAVVNKRFPFVDERLVALEDLVEDAAKGPAAVEAAVAETNILLAELDAVLQKMLKLESYNEIVDLVRDLLKEQTGVQDDTKREQRRELEE